MNEKFALMHAEKALHAIEFMAKMLKVSRAGYYAWVTRRGTLSTAQVRRAAVTARCTYTPPRAGFCRS